MNPIELLSALWMSPDALLPLVIRLLIDLLFLSAVVATIGRDRSKLTFVFPIYLFNITIFGMCHVLSHNELSLGSGFGLFAILAMLRYRSQQLNLHEMTYMLVAIGLGIFNSTLSATISRAEVLFFDCVVLLVIVVLNHWVLQKRQHCKKVKYDNMTLIRLGDQKQLISDVATRTGLNVLKVEVESYNLVENVVSLAIYYRSNDAIPGKNNHRPKLPNLHLSANSQHRGRYAELSKI
jgi:hypothetical protein